MSISEIPSKIVERAESLTEKKLEVAMELTKIIYSTARGHIGEEEVLATYFRVFKSIKEVSPPPLEKRVLKKLPPLSMVIIVGLLCIVAGIYLLYRVKMLKYLF